MLKVGHVSILLHMCVALFIFRIINCALFCIGISLRNMFIPWHVVLHGLHFMAFSTL